MVNAGNWEPEASFALLRRDDERLTRRLRRLATGGMRRGCARFVASSGLRFCLLGQFLSVEVTDYTRHIGPGLMVRRHTTVLLHPLRACIVGSQCLDQVEVIAFQKLT